MRKEHLEYGHVRVHMHMYMSCVVHVRLHVNVQVLFSFIVRILGVIFAPSHTHGSLAGMRGMRLLLPSRSRRVHVYAQVSLRPNSFGTGGASVADGRVAAQRLLRPATEAL